MAIRTDEKLSASLEDYLEAIYHLTARQDVARSKDIADSMGVTRASVTGALRALSEKIDCMASLRILRGILEP